MTLNCLADLLLQKIIGYLIKTYRNIWVTFISIEMFTGITGEKANKSKQNFRIQYHRL